MIETQIKTFAQILDKNAKKFMKKWDLAKFTSEYPSLYYTILKSMEEISETTTKQSIEYSGWDCFHSPTGQCNYNQPDGDYDEDSCIYCGQPEERK